MHRKKSTSNEAAATVLVADDQEDITTALSILLAGEGHRVCTAHTVEDAVATLRRGHVDILLAGLNFGRGRTSGDDGLTLIKRARDHDSRLPIVVLTALGNVDTAVRAMQAGAQDFLVKPWDNNRLLQTLRTQLGLSASLRTAERLQNLHTQQQEDASKELLGTSTAIQNVRSMLRRLGPTDANVLITGENGTGKGVAARLLHALSPRREQPLVSVNAAALSDSVVESELFGHVRGAFTGAHAERMGRFAMAEGGTLFLDEIADISPTMQAALLRVIETGEYEMVGSSRTLIANVRIIAATNADLKARVQEGRFREDLLFRLDVVGVQMPALRTRRQDIEALATHFLSGMRTRYRRPSLNLSSDAMTVLKKQPWPGNVRQLSHTIERATLLSMGDIIEADDLGLESEPVCDDSTPERNDGELNLAEAERALICRALGASGGHVPKAAQALGLSRSGLYRRMEKHGIAAPRSDT